MAELIRQIFGGNFIEYKVCEKGAAYAAPIQLWSKNKMDFKKWIEDCFITYICSLAIVVLILHYHSINIIFCITVIFLLSGILLTMHFELNIPDKIWLHFLTFIEIIGLPLISTWIFHTHLESSTMLEFWGIMFMLLLSLILIAYMFWRINKISRMTILKEAKREKEELNFWSNGLSFLGAAFPIWVSVHFNDSKIKGWALLFALLCLTLILGVSHTYARTIWKRMDELTPPAGTTTSTTKQSTEDAK